MNKRWFHDNVHFPEFRTLGSSLLTALLQFLGENPDGPLVLCRAAGASSSHSWTGKGKAAVG